MPLSDVKTIMRITTTLLHGLFAWCALACDAALASADWSLARHAEGIKVWTRDVSGYPLREFRAETTVHSTLAGLVTLVMDTEQAATWIYRTRRVDILQRNNRDATFVVRMVTDFPWPLTDRDAVVAGRIFQAGDGTVHIISQSLQDDSTPDDPALVRMRDFYGNWTFRPLPDGRVHVTMQGRADPGGTLPHAIVNLLIHDTPFQTLRGLRRVIGQPRYQQSVQPTIREPAPHDGN